MFDVHGFEQSTAKQGSVLSVENFGFISVRCYFQYLHLVSLKICSFTVFHLRSLAKFAAVSKES